MKFKVGDKARVKYVRLSINGSPWREGAEVTILDVTIKRNPIDGDVCDCSIAMTGGFTAYPMFDQLEPIVPPQELSSWEEIQKLTNWSPQKIAEIQ